MLQSEVGNDVTTRRQTPATIYDDSALRLPGSRGYCDIRSAERRISGSSSPQFPAIGKQLSATCVELESVGRTNIVSTVKQFFEDISASFTPRPRRLDGRRPPDRARSRSALGIVTPTSGHDMNADTGSSGDHHQKHQQSLSRRQLDFSSTKKLSETAHRKSTTSTSGVGSLSVRVIKTPDVVVAHHSDMSRKINGHHDTGFQAETIENSLAASAHDTSHVKQVCSERGENGEA